MFACVHVKKGREKLKMIRKIGVHLANLNGTELEVTFPIQCDPSGSALPEFLSF